MFEHGFEVRHIRGINAGGVEGVGKLFVQIQEHAQYDLSFFIHAIVLFHAALEFLFEAFAPGLGRLEDFLVRGWDRLSLQQGDDIGRSAIGNGQIQGRVIVVILLESAFGIGVVEGFHHFEGGIVVGGVVEGEIAVIVLLGGTFGIDFEEQFFDVEGSLFPRRKVEGQIPIVIRERRRLGIGLQEGFGDFERRTKGGRTVQGKIATIVLDAAFVSIKSIYE